MLRKLRLPTIRFDWIGNRLDFIFTVVLNAVVYAAFGFGFFLAVTSLVPPSLQTTLLCVAVPAFGVWWVASR